MLIFCDGSFPRSRLLRLPRELIDQITSYIVKPWVSLSEHYDSLCELYDHDPEVMTLEEPDILGTSDLVCLALTCRYFLAILHSTIRNHLRRDAAAPWAGAGIWMEDFSSRSEFPTPHTPTVSTPHAACSAVVEVLKRLNKDGEKSKSQVRRIFTRKILGRRGFECGRREDGRYWRTIVVLRNHFTRQYVREEILDRLRYRCCLGDMLLACPWTTDQHDVENRCDISIVTENEMIFWEDVTTHAISNFEASLYPSIPGVGKRADV